MNAIRGLLARSSSDQEQLYTAVVSNNVADVKKLLPGFKEINTPLRNYGGRNALHLAVEKGFIEIIELLLENGADPMRQIHDKEKRNAIELSFDSFRPDCLEIVLSDCDIMIGQMWQRFIDHRYNRSNISTDPAKVLEILRILIIATPLLSDEQWKIIERFLDDYSHIDSTTFILALILTDPDKEKLNNIVSKQRNELIEWQKSFKKIPVSLQYHCRSVIRKNLPDNVYYLKQQLPLPNILLKYIVSIQWECSVQIPPPAPIAELMIDYYHRHRYRPMVPGPPGVIRRVMMD